MIDLNRTFEHAFIQPSPLPGAPMIPIQALPDELLLGFKARLAIVYGIHANAALNRKLVAVHKHQTGSDVTPVVALLRLGAAAGHCSEWDFLMRHSNVAVNATLDNPLTPEELVAGLDRPRMAQIMSPSSIHLRLCKQCVAEDLSVLRFSYWRRSHHIPGRYVCESHQAPLLLAPTEPHLASLPHHWVDCSEPVDDFLVQNHNFNHYVRWYIDHMDRVASGQHLIDGGKYRSEVYATLKSWRRTGAGWATQLACLMSDAFTVEWLSATVSRTCASIEGITQTLVPTVIYDYTSASQRQMAVAAGLAFASPAPGQSSK
jgi:TniQ